MKPMWFNIEDIPYDKMWKDDTYWMPYLFHSEGPQYFIGAAYFDKENVMLNHQFKSIQDNEQQIGYLLNGQYDKLDLDYSVLINKQNVQEPTTDTTINQKEVNSNEQ